MQEKGRILKGVGGYYTVRGEDGKEHICFVRGRFRREGITPLAGDAVLFERQQEGHAAIIDILPRKNALLRPPVANIDLLVIVLSLTAPKPDFMLADKLILSAYPHNIEPILVFNKCDADKRGAARDYLRQYAPHYEARIVSAKTGEGIGALRERLTGNISCFAGQSAVGKSSLLNAALGLALPVGGLAKKTERGRHTTRHVELLPLQSGAVLDTPGFSLLEAELVEQDMLNRAYREFSDAPARCRFFACTHRSEPDCAVKALLKEGKIAKERFARYEELLLELEDRRKRIYD